MINILLSFALALSVFSIKFGTCQDIPWSYSGPLGPDYWCEIPVDGNQCCGSRQSPILIETTQTIDSDYFLELNGMDTPWDLMSITNDGHTVMLRVPNTYSKPYLLYYINPLTVSDTYLFEQLHFHFGGNDSVGSEHVIDGERFPMEMHVVFYNSKYYSFAAAKNYSDGVVVVGVHFHISSHNSNFDPIVDALPYVQYAGQEFIIQPGFPLEHLLPSDTTTSYSYLGSLTTPVCNEAVTWFVLQEHVPIAESQMLPYRLLRTISPEGKHVADEFGRVNIDTDTFMFNNFRPTQNLNGRIVFAHQTDAMWHHEIKKREAAKDIYH